jgi:hypothetical protein
MTRQALAAALLAALWGVGAMADDAQPGIRVVGSTIYTLDAKGHTTGTVRETSPGQWHQRDMKGSLVRAMELPLGCTPFIPCRSKKSTNRD